MHPILRTAAGLALTGLCAFAGAAEPAAEASGPTLAQTIAALDTQVFDAFNRCSDPAQLAIHAGYFAADVEFYHDQGGVTWTRDQMLANTQQYACGKFTRVLIPGSLVVHPIKDFGAMALGSHRFCQVDSGSCDGLADFTMIWRQTGDTWEITRVLSYGHRAAHGS